MTNPNAVVAFPLAKMATNKYGIPTGLILATIGQESGWRKDALRIERKINDASYGLTGGYTGQLSRLNLAGFEQIGTTTTLPGGASSVSVTSSGVSFAGAGKAAQKDDFGTTFTGGGTALELAFNEDVTRLLWIAE